MERTRSLSIGQLASATGLAAKTIRYYEEMGVLPTPRRTAAGYRQYARRDVHRVLFIRRARALGFPLDKLRALTADLDVSPSRTMRPRLRQLVTEHLHTLREQLADFRVLEQQLEQVLQRLRTGPSAKCFEAGQCLEGAARAASEPPPSRSLRRARGGTDMNGDATMEGITRLAATNNGDCDCGCSCAGGGAVGAKPALIRLPRGSAPARRDAPGRPRPDRTPDSRPSQR
jgi:DNA-binding transcriptional MerR regulator